MHFCLSRNYSLSFWTPISLTLSKYKYNFIPLILFFSAHLSSFTFIMLWGFKHIFNYLLGFSNPLEFRKIFICYHFITHLLCLHIVLTRPAFSHSLIHFSFEVEVDGFCQILRFHFGSERGCLVLRTRVRSRSQEVGWGAKLLRQSKEEIKCGAVLQSHQAEKELKQNSSRNDFRRIWNSPT